MELSTAANTAVATTAAAVNTSEPKTETPTRNQPEPFTNGVLKRHAPPSHLHHGHPVVVTYKECLKNHAAAMGGHAVDGCGEFMPSPSSTPSDPTSLKCAACGCHRNFHRRDPDITTAAAAQIQPPSALEYQPHHRHLPPPPRVSPNDDADDDDGSPNDSPSPPPISSTYPHNMLLALSGGQQGHHRHHHHVAPAPGGVGHLPPAVLSNSSSTRKRFRTKFTQDQKEKMLEFSEKVGWKIQKKDEDIINEFLNGIGVERGVFKVWMHNNKNTFVKKDHQQQISSSPNTTTTTSNNNAAAITTTGNNTVLPCLNNDDNHGGNGLNIYSQEMRSSIRIQNISHEQQMPAANGPDRDISTGTSGNGFRGVGANASNSSSS